MKAAKTQKLNQGKKSGNQTHQLAYQKYNCTAQSRAMGRRRRYGDHSPQKKKKNSIQNSVESEEIGNPVLDFNKPTVNLTKELSNTHKTNLKEEISEKFMEKISDMVNQNVQDALNKFQVTKTKRHEMIQRQIREPREHLNKHQSEIKDTIKKEIHELKRCTNY
jgi:hypothetical protein